MADTINELYAKYADGVEQSLVDSKYFQYLFEMVQAGDNTLHQTRRVLHKVVDEEWLKVVEEGIDSIFNIVDKPRRFITTSEEVVPVALARKITADSVRHLSQNTQFITANAKGEIRPTHILNVTTEETYDLYENRFIYHLIQRLFAFVDKRTDVIFWSTGDETCNVLNMESKVDDAYEEISYKVEMTIRNRQSVVENDTDHMDLFKRIDRVRRLSRVLRTSSFCEIMSGCSAVRSPIQRTNLMMKDPDYRTCYKLWQFMESYDEVGYHIEPQDSALQFDEEYLLQMYTNLITNYTVFKSLLESDPRRMTEIATEKREPIAPKFVKEVQEELVDSPDVPDVEIRKVFVEEVTQAQLDAEEKLREEQARNEDLDAANADLQRRIDVLQMQLESVKGQVEALEQIHEEMESEKSKLEQQLEAERVAKTEMETAMKKMELETRAQINAIRDEAKDIVYAARKEANTKVETAQKNAAASVRTAQKKAEAEVQEARKNAGAAVKKAQEEAETNVAAAKKQAEENAWNVRKEADEAVQIARAAAEQRAAEEIAEAKKEADGAIAAVRKQAEAAVAQAQKRAEEAEKQAEKARAKAEANSLSRYLTEALRERKERKKEKDNREE
ncbi:MAG: DUF2357 domain-containing protein [Lachnospiraceae bacterium]|nr:DUF2357 domain-containing protein [Lachnospiraceae bacterium]